MRIIKIIKINKTKIAEKIAENIAENLKLCRKNIEGYIKTWVITFGVLGCALTSAFCTYKMRILLILF